MSNYVYLDKRGIYLHYIAEQLSKNEEYKKRIYFEGYQGDPSKPILCISPRVKTNKSQEIFTIKIHIKLSEKVFKLSRLLPNRNNFNPNLTTMEDSTAKLENKQKTQKNPEKEEKNPEKMEINEEKNEEISKKVEKMGGILNSYILEDIYSMEHLKLLNFYLAANKVYLDSIILIKVWLRQREFDQTRKPNFSGFLGSMILIYLIKFNKINSQMSSYQIFKIFLHFLSTDQLLEGISLSEEFSPSQKAIFKNVFEVVFVDNSNNLNLTNRLRKSDFLQIQNQAKLSISLLDNYSTGFHYLFLSKIPSSLQLDHFFIVSDFLPNAEKVISMFKDAPLSPEGFNHFHFAFFHQSLVEIFNLLKEALPDRIELLFINFTNLPEWNLSSTASPSLSDVKLLVSLKINRENAFDNLIRGPSADLPLAARFRLFFIFPPFFFFAFSILLFYSLVERTHEKH